MRTTILMQLQLKQIIAHREQTMILLQRQEKLHRCLEEQIKS